MEIKMVKSILVAIFCILIPFSSQAVESLGINSQGDLHITVFITDSTSFLSEWIESPPSHALTISTINEIKYNQLVYAGFAITGFTKGSDAKVNFVVDIQVSAPDGSILLRGEKWAVYSKEVTIDKGVIIANPFLAIKVEPTDPVGDYKISATVTDNISSKSATSSAVIKINQPD
jgi:hypothetical protein